MELVSCDDILHLREKYRKEADAKGVKLISQLTVLTSALEKYEPISAISGSCGGWQSFHEFIIGGGPDDGKRVDAYPWYSAESLEYSAAVFNGSREEYDSYMGYPARPSISYVGELHAVTIAYLSAILITWRERSMAEHVISLYDRLPID
jgi:hypothetical protein